jgi:glycosyltransferase involved in cell wall biosynthesis
MRGPVERWIQRTSMARLYPYADAVIVTSAGAADDMASYTGLDRSRIRVVPPPVVPARLFDAMPPRPDHPWFDPSAPPLVLGAGELGWRKDFDTAIRAFAQVRQQRPCRLMILGRGREAGNLQELARSLGVADDVAFPGFVDDPYPYMAHADVFLFTSRWEGLGFVIIEALAVGTPVVATDCPSGPREILQEGRYGHLVPVGDEASVARGVVAALDSPMRPEMLRAAARPYELETSADAYLDVFQLPRRP